MYQLPLPRFDRKLRLWTSLLIKLIDVQQMIFLNLESFLSSLKSKLMGANQYVAGIKSRTANDIFTIFRRNKTATVNIFLRNPYLFLNALNMYVHKSNAI